MKEKIKKALEIAADLITILTGAVTLIETIIKLLES